jgi:hypothetical protein
MGATSCATIATDKNLLASAEPRYVLFKRSEWQGRDAIKVRLSEQEQDAQLRGAGANRPTMLILSRSLRNGTIEADIAAAVNGRGGPNARGFAGVAFHLDDRGEAFEAVYLRMSNGTLNVPAPESPRDVRAVQYIAHPGFHFETSRQNAPGRYERAAPVRLGKWHRLRVVIDGSNLKVFVDGKPVLSIDDLKRANELGRVALWVGDGTDAYFRDVVIRSARRRSVKKATSG